MEVKISLIHISFMLGAKMTTPLIAVPTVQGCSSAERSQSKAEPAEQGVLEGAVPEVRWQDARENILEPACQSSQQLDLPLLQQEFTAEC